MQDKGVANTAQVSWQANGVSVRKNDGERFPITELPTCRVHAARIDAMTDEVLLNGAGAGIHYLPAFMKLIKNQIRSR